MSPDTDSSSAERRVTALPEAGRPGPTRDTDRQQLPGRMRRDVRLLGDMLGEVLRDSGGQDLLDDVERLRQAVIAARISNGPAARSGGAAADMCFF